MKFLVGLGNPGQKYAKNRHNVGFMFLDTICNKWKADNKFYGEAGEIQMDGEKILLLKPTTFMNESGKAVVVAARFHKINVSDILVVHDDLDLSFGTYKIQQGKGPKIHNGLISIEKSLESVDFWRVRIGIESRPLDKKGSGENYVLSNFSGDEMRVLDEVFTEIKIRLAADL